MKVSTINLSPKLDNVGPTHGTINRGEMSAETLTSLLKEFSCIDPVQNHEHDPRIIVQTRSANHAIRTGRGRLQLYNARDNTQPGVEMSLPKLIEAIEESTPVADEPDQEYTGLIPPASGRREYRKISAGILLLLGLSLNAWGVHQYLNREPVSPTASYIPITDEAKISLVRRKLSGVYATGSDSGSRVITLPRDGTITFQLLYRDADSTIKTAPGITRKCVVGQLPNGVVRLVTNDGRQIGIGADGSLNYSGDTYQRVAVLTR